MVDMTAGVTVVAGTVREAVEPVLRSRPGYATWVAGSLDQHGWNALIDDAAPELIASGLPPSEIPFMRRLANDPAAAVQSHISDLVARGILPADGGRQRLLQGHNPRYDHAGFRTFIYPEEGYLLAGVCEALKPRQVLFLGSYYGYWASFAAPPVVDNGGSITLVDPDANVCAVAARNFEAMGVPVSIAVTTGEAFLANATSEFDLVAIDAETPRSHPDPGVRGKGIYHGLLAASLPKMSATSALICHNILFADRTGDPAFESIIERNVRELGPFMHLAQQHFDFFECATTEGVGIGRRRADHG
jgi:predicted O-methyltransferase YrrM